LLEGSPEIPHITIKGKQVIHLEEIDDTTQHWTYKLSMGDANNSVNLRCKQTTKSWKGTTFLGKWLVVPHFDIEGAIYIDGKQVNVSGTGYHDHNLYPLYAPFKIQGYHFGKFAINSINITWAQVSKKRQHDELLVVVNTDGKYGLINANNIHFNIDKYMNYKGNLIPKNGSLEIQSDALKLQTNMEVVNLHHINMPTLNYWRYHLRYTGTLFYKNKSSSFDVVDISEYMRFF